MQNVLLVGFILLVFLSRFLSYFEIGFLKSVFLSRYISILLQGVASEDKTLMNEHPLLTDDGKFASRGYCIQDISMYSGRGFIGDDLEAPVRHGIGESNFYMMSWIKHSDVHSSAETLGF